MTEATFESVKGKLEVIAPYLRHSHTVKITTIFPITTKHKIKKSTIIEKTNNTGKKEEKFNENERRHREDTEAENQGGGEVGA